MTDTRTEACNVKITQGPNKGKLATGHWAGYTRHIRADQAPCDACAKAANDYKHTYRKRLRGQLATGELEPMVCREKRGTHTGYLRHALAGEPRCQECLDAWADYLHDLGYTNRRRRSRKADG